MRTVPKINPNISMHEEQVMKCPVCNNNLSVFDYNNVEVDICSKGCGIWFDYGETKAIEESSSLEEIDAAFYGELEEATAQSAQKQLETDKARLNPRTGKALERYEWNLGSGIVFDRCPETGGLWLDSGEIEAYASHVKKFRKNTPQMSAELKGKLNATELEASQKFDNALDKVANTYISWDFGLVDDMLRGMIKGVLNKN